MSHCTFHNDLCWTGKVEDEDVELSVVDSSSFARLLTDVPVLACREWDRLKGSWNRMRTSKRQRSFRMRAETELETLLIIGGTLWW